MSEGGRAEVVYDLGKVKIDFQLFLTEWSVSYQILVTGSKNIVPSRSYLILNLENADNYSTHANFKRDLPKMDIIGISKSIFYKFWNIPLNLCSYIHRVKTPKLIEPNIDLGLWKLFVAENLSKKATDDNIFKI